MKLLIFYFLGFFVGWLGVMFLDLFARISGRIMENFPIGTFAPAILAIVAEEMTRIYLEISIDLISYLGMGSLGKLIAAEFGATAAIYGDKLLEITVNRRKGF